MGDFGVGRVVGDLSMDPGVVPAMETTATMLPVAVPCQICQVLEAEIIRLKGGLARQGGGVKRKNSGNKGLVRSRTEPTARRPRTVWEALAVIARFEDMMRKLVRVPKKEVDDKIVESRHPRKKPA